MADRMDDPQLEDLTYAELVNEYRFRFGSKRRFKSRGEAIRVIRRRELVDG